MRKLLTSISAAAALIVPAAILPAANASANASAATSRPAIVQAAVQALRGGTPNLPLRRGERCGGPVTDNEAVMAVCIDHIRGSRYQVGAAIRNDANSDITVNFDLYFQPDGQYLGSCANIVVVPGGFQSCNSDITRHTRPVYGQTDFTWTRDGLQFSDSVITGEFT
jgi:hypothetical protein